MRFRFNKYSIAALSIVIATICCCIFNDTLIKSFASNNNYFAGYNDVVSIELDNNYSATQGFHIHKNEAYFVKISKNSSVEKSRIWVYNFETKTNIPVYNGNTDNVVFEIGHANCMYVNAGFIYIATLQKNSPSICRYRIGNSNGKRYLYDRKMYSVYSDAEQTKLVSIAGINFSADLSGFLLKSGNNIYYGNFTDDKFIWTKRFTLDKNVTVKTKSGTETINTDNYTHQGLFYKNGKIYISLMNNKQYNQSVVLAYNINNSSQNNSVLQEDGDFYCRITSKQYSKLFEIEDVACYNGEMYCNINATYTGGGSYDRIIKIKDFKF